MDHLITALSAQKRNPQRVNVYLDGEFAFGLTRIVAAWLSVGQKIDDEKIARLQDEDRYESAYQRALKFINYQPRSEAEIRQNLQKFGTPEKQVEQIVDRLKQLDLVDDQRFAMAWVENRNTFRPRSRRALTAELRQRGIEPQTIDDVLQDIDEETLAYQAACKQARKLQNLEWENYRQKMVQFLARRGFSYTTSMETATRVWEEIQSIDSE
jgi:regulatory protein